jgi:hypothetical protein
MHNHTAALKAHTRSPLLQLDGWELPSGRLVDLQYGVKLLELDAHYYGSIGYRQ